MPLALRRPKFRLRTTLVLPIILQTVAAVGLVSYLLHLNERKTVEQLVTQLSTQASEQVSLQLNQYLAIPRQANELTLQAIALGMLNPQDFDTTGRFLWKQMQVFPNLGYMNFASPQGAFIGVGREDDGTLYTERIVPPQTNRYDRYSLDSQGNLTQRLATDVYTFQEDEWYTSAVKAGTPVWSSIYQWQDRPEVLSISSSYPVYGEANQLVGVLGVDFILSQISDFLRQMEISPSGKIFIIERDGMLVASSSAEPPYRQVAGEAVRLNIVDSQEPLLRTAAEQLRDRIGSFDQITTPQLVPLQVEGERALLSITPWQDDLGLDWLVGVVIPEADFTAQIRGNARRTLGLGLGALGLAIASGILTARWVNRQMQGIAQAAEAIAAGKLDQVAGSSNLVEIDRLASAFNRMAQEMKTSIDALRQSENRNQAILNAIPDLLLRINREGYYLDVRTARDGTWVACAENRLGRRVDEVLPAAVAQQYHRAIAQVMATNTTQTLEYQLESGDTHCDYEARVARCGQEEVLFLVRDITDRKAADTALAESEARFRSLTTNIPGVIYRCQCDDRWTIEYISEAIERLSGYPASDFIQNRVRNFASLIHPEDLALVEVVINHAIVIQEPFLLEYRILHRDGSIRWVDEHGQAMVDDEGNPIYIDGAIFDVSDRKQAELALNQSEAQSRAILEAIPDMMFRVGVDGVYRGFGTQHRQLDLVAHTENPVGQSMADLLPPELAERQGHYLQQALQTGELQVYEQEITLNGHRQAEEVRVIKSGEDEVLFMVRDISDRKQAEAALAESEQRFRSLVSNIPGAIYRCHCDADWTVEFISDAITTIAGYPKAEFINNQTRSLLRVIHPEDQAMVNAMRKYALLMQDTFVIDYRLLHQDGSTRWVSEQGRGVFDEEGKPLYLDGAIFDITDPKRAEEALKIAEENYRSIFENALEGIFQSSLEGRFMSVNPAMARIYGYGSPAEMLSTITDISTQVYVDPKDQATFKRQMKQQDQVNGLEYQVFKKNGEIIWIQEDARAVRNSEGRLLYYEGMVQDITARKRQEAELRRQLEELKIEIDQQKREAEVAELTQSTYFQEVRQEVAKVDLDEFWR